MTLSKILTDIFRTANNLTHCKTTNQLCAGDASGTLASAILSCDRYSIFEQDYPRSGLIRQAVRHTGHSVHTSLVTTFNLLFKNIHLSTSLINNVSQFIELTLPYSPEDCRDLRFIALLIVPRLHPSTFCTCVQELPLSINLIIASCLA